MSSITDSDNTQGTEERGAGNGSSSLMDTDEAVSGNITPPVPVSRGGKRKRILSLSGLTMDEGSFGRVQEPAQAPIQPPIIQPPPRRSRISREEVPVAVNSSASIFEHKEEFNVEDLPFIKDFKQPRVVIPEMENGDTTQETSTFFIEKLTAHWLDSTPPSKNGLREWALKYLGIRQWFPTDSSLKELKFSDLEFFVSKRHQEIFMAETYIKSHYKDARSVETLNAMEHIFNSMRIAYMTVQTEMLAEQVFDKNSDLTLVPRKITMNSLNILRDVDKITPVQNLLIYMFDKILAAGYRRLGSQCYKEILSPDGYGTHAWEPVVEISELVYQKTSRDENYEQWLNATKGGVLKETVVNLTNCYDSHFPSLRPDRYLFSFQNGQFDVMNNTFHRNTGNSVLSTDRVAIKYFDCMFADHLDPSVCDDWRDIETPLFDSIFEHQGYSRETIDVVYAMLGRLLFPVNERDLWQVCPFFKGVAGCGKSTVAAVVSNWYPAKFVSTISCNMEDKFGLENVADTYMCLCTEVTKKFPLNRGVWQSMVTGESVVVPRKNKGALQGPWTTPLGMFGNEFPNYDDKSGSVHRRSGLFLMPKQVDPSKADPQLQKKLQSDPAPLLVKCSRAYLDLSRRCGNSSFWKDAASAQMHKWHNEHLEHIDKLTAFIRSDEITLDPNGYCTEKQFRSSFREWLAVDGITMRSSDMSPEHISQVLESSKVRKETRELMWEGSSQTLTFYVGMRIKGYDVSLDDNNEDLGLSFGNSSGGGGSNNGVRL